MKPSAPVLLITILSSLLSGCYWFPGAYSPEYRDQYDPKIIHKGTEHKHLKVGHQGYQKLHRHVGSGFPENYPSHGGDQRQTKESNSPYGEQSSVKHYNR